MSEILNLGGNIEIAVVILKSVFALRGSSPNNTPNTKKELTDRLEELRNHRDLDPNEIKEIVYLIDQLKTVPDDKAKQLLPAIKELPKKTMDSINTMTGLTSALKSIFKKNKKRLLAPEIKKEIEKAVAESFTTTLKFGFTVVNNRVERITSAEKDGIPFDPTEINKILEGSKSLSSTNHSVITETDLNAIKTIVNDMIIESQKLQNNEAQIAILKTFADACKSSEGLISYLSNVTNNEKLFNLDLDQAKRMQIVEVIRKYHQLDPNLDGGRKKTKRKYRQNKKTLKRR